MRISVRRHVVGAKQSLAFGRHEGLMYLIYHEGHGRESIIRAPLQVTNPPRHELTTRETGDTLFCTSMSALVFGPSQDQYLCTHWGRGITCNQYRNGSVPGPAK